MKIIIPCAGKSSRYPNLRPKFLLTNPNGKLMIQDVMDHLFPKYEIIITVLKEHKEKYNLQNIFGNMHVIDESASQSETIYKTLIDKEINEPFFVKDSDSIFKLNTIEEAYNYVCVDSLDNNSRIDVLNKSYVLGNPIKEIAEKKVISNYFSVGGYYFTDPKVFIRGYEESVVSGEKYISDVIKHLLSMNSFLIKEVSEYVDLGTIEDWHRWKSKHKSYFVDIDGVLVETSSRYFEPTWGTTKGIKENINTINNLYDNGSQIIITTAREESFREITKGQLEREGVKYHQLVMGLLHSPRVMINDFSNSNPYPVSEAISIPRNGNLEHYIMERY
ncbi:MAG: hypothetical protein WC998_07060 [Candidatus Paceibacterota bacterium]